MNGVKERSFCVNFEMNGIISRRAVTINVMDIAAATKRLQAILFLLFIFLSLFTMPYTTIIYLKQKKIH